jgi:hypothetical protein
MAPIMSSELSWLTTGTSIARAGKFTSGAPRGPLTVRPGVDRTVPRSSLKCKYRAVPVTLGK